MGSREAFTDPRRYFPILRFDFDDMKLAAEAGVRRFCETFSFPMAVRGRETFSHYDDSPEAGAVLPFRQFSFTRDCEAGGVRAWRRIRENWFRGGETFPELTLLTEFWYTGDLSLAWPTSILIRGPGSTVRNESQ
jgi:hypothetical protein